MPLDPQRLLSLPPQETRHSFTVRDTILYALGVGADDLRFLYEDGLQALPTMAVVLAYPGFFWRNPAYGIDWKKILHGETSVELAGPLPVEGDLIGRTTIDAIYDKGADKGAIVLSSRRIEDASGTHLATVRNTLFLRGDGGFGGQSEGAPRPHPVPADRAPDHVVTLSTAENQALIYRLSGDYNPLHADPAVAAAAGFPRPILHGLCTYGVAGRALLAALCGNDPARMRRMDVRFSSPVFPGETIKVEIWRENGNGDAISRAAFRATAEERGVLVLNNGYAELATP
ncbi:MAG: MaoC family dehydratase [Alphaproteobacteria bacterium]|nr:MaoC family dehydratase [Alphaproteobacteria bacterium]